MSSNDPLPGQCGARVKQSDGYCRKAPINGTGRCRLHGGAGGAPEGNQNAVGNSGGGAPELNKNAWKHGGFTDTQKLDARLVGDAREHVDRMAESMSDRAAETAPEIPVERRRELAREAAVVMFQESLANADLFSAEDGSGGRGMGWDRERTVERPDGEPMTITEPVVNPAFRQTVQLMRRQHRIWDELNLWPNP